MENTHASHGTPYPPIRVAGPNCVYAQAMLDNLGGSNSEMSAVSLYFYNHLVTQAHEEVSSSFHAISLVEMRHLEIFGRLALLLGEDPRLWTQRQCRKSYWTPGYNRYPTRLPELLLCSIQGEKDAIRKYQCQMETIRDPGITENLARIIEDEQEHVRILARLYESCGGSPSR